MGKKKKKKEKLSSILTPEQKQKFRSFGKPDLSQNWLEIFTDDMISDLFTIMRSCSDNQRKADYIIEEFKDYGFQVVGLGTNILTMSNPYYPGVVFKIALDDYGIADNFNDCVLVDAVPRYNRVFARDPAAMISVQERLVLPTQAQMDMFMPQILGLLKELSKYYLIADLSPDMFLNYGVTRDGEFRFIDASDLYPLSQMKKDPRCNRIVGEHKHTGKFKYCEGKLKYTDDFKYLVCEKCGKEFNPLEFRPRKDVEKMSKILQDGTTAEERDVMEREELHAIMTRRGLKETVPERKFFEDDPDEDPDDPLASLRDENGRIDRSIPVEEQEDEDEEPDREDDQDDTVYVDDGEEDPSSEEDSESQDEGDDEEDGFQSLRPTATFKGFKPREVALPNLMEGKLDGCHYPAEEADADDEARIGSGSDGATAAIPQESVQETVQTLKEILNEGTAKETGHGEPSEDADAEEASIEKEASHDDGPSKPADEDVQAFLALMNYLKAHNGDIEQQMYAGFVKYFAEFVEREAKTLVAKAIPKVENDSPNKNSTDGSEDDPIGSDVPHIRYRVTNDDGSEDTSKIPAIVLDVTGDFEQAYSEFGLSMYVTIDHGGSLYRAVQAFQLHDMIKDAVDSALADQADLHNWNGEGENSGNSDGE